MKGKLAIRETQCFQADFPANEPDAAGFTAARPRFEGLFGPPDAVKTGLLGLFGSHLESKSIAERASRVAPLAAGDPGFRAQPRRRRQRPAGIRHRAKYLRHRCAGRRTPLLAALRAGSAGDSQRSPGHHCGFAQVLPQLARQDHVDYPCRNLSAGRSEVFPPIAQP